MRMSKPYGRIVTVDQSKIDGVYGDGMVLRCEVGPPPLFYSTVPQRKLLYLYMSCESWYIDDQRFTSDFGLLNPEIKKLLREADLTRATEVLNKVVDRHFNDLSPEEKEEVVKFFCLKGDPWPETKGEFIWSQRLE